MAAIDAQWSDEALANSRDPLGDMMRAARGAFVAAAAFSFAVNIAILAMPFYMFSVFTLVLPTESLGTLGLLGLVVVWVLAVQLAIDVARTLLLGHVARWIDRRVGRRLFDLSIRRSIPRGAAADMTLMSRLQRLRQFIASPRIFVVMDAPWVPVFVLVLFVMNVWIGLTALAVMSIVLVLAIGSRLATDKIRRDAGAAAAGANALAGMAIRNADSMEALGMTGRVVQRWRATNDRMIELQAVASRRAGLFHAFVKMMRVGSMAAVITVAAVQMFQPESAMAPGVMMAALLLVGRCIMPLELVVGSSDEIVDALRSFRMLREALKADDSAWRESIVPSAPEGRLEVVDLVYRPPNVSRTILNRVRFALKPGESLGIVGPTASGKSSLARLLTGIEAPTAGDVRLDGTMLHAWPSEERGRHVGYLPQRVELMAGTVFENVTRFEIDADEEAAWRAIDLAGARPVVEALSGGLYAEVGENGGFLSGGQRQRIGLARALYGDVRLVVLDEPNANLDAQGEEALVGALKALKARGTTVAVILHRPSILNHVDYIMVLRDGGIQKFAPRAEMLPLITGIARTVGEDGKPRRVAAAGTAPRRIEAAGAPGAGAETKGGEG